MKILGERQRSGGARTELLLVSISPRGARSLAFLTVLRLCRRVGARGKPLAVEKVRAGPVHSWLTQPPPGPGTGTTYPPTAFFKALEIMTGKARSSAELAEVA